MYANMAAEQLGHAPVERRERRPVTLRGFAIREDGSRTEALLLDLSYEGCGIESPVDFNAGETLRLAVLGRGEVEAKVRWCSGGKAGLVFTADEPQPRPHWPRRSERTTLAAEASLRRLGKINYRTKIFDLSPIGCKVELVDMPRLEEHVLIKFEGLESLECEVCWIAGNCAGLRFEKAIHPAVFEVLVERLRATH
jgi:hypothetical protein